MVKSPIESRNQSQQVRRLTQEEIARFEVAEAQEDKIKHSYGKYSEFDSIKEGQWIMKVGLFADLPTY
ncbi:hypothetical protein [Vibrio agarivorans]|uniref:hypothetical protein n=1 Tax=Vibrio agarivorans TaxID=153622 RepID=UPI0025B39D26|nr:hypothetical protein [Vibrio agarivorans]MDN3661120.1 hypothetical protein [Vibrio agarivorans]